MRVLFTLLAELGHIHPFVGICQRLTRAGHEVAVHCARDFSAQFKRAGIDAEWFTMNVEPSHPPALKLAERMRNERWLERWYTLAVSTTPQGIHALEPAVRSFRPDVMCVDPANCAGAVVAEQEGIPWAAVSTNFASLRPEGVECMFLDVGTRVMVGLRELLASQGFHVPTMEGAEVVSPWFNSSFTTEVFVPRAQTSNRYSHYVGPARADGARGDEPDFPWDKLDGRPLVYVSGGGGQSLGFDAACLLRIARGLAPSEATVVIAAHGLHEDAAFRAALPGNCITTRYAPQRELLQRAAAAVIHGGVNSTNECLDSGCPMLVLPLGKEQPVQAELVRRAGVGIALDPLAMSDEECAGALRALVAGGSYRDRARAVRDSYRATDSATAICAALEQLARRERPAAPT